MQKSTSFSDGRIGKARPSNILSSRGVPSESLPWPSPSFNMQGNVSASGDLPVSADPGRPSTQVKTSPTGGLPPTPLTATYKPLDMANSGSASNDKDHLRLPGVRDMLAHTPPDSQTKRSVPLPLQQEHEVAPPMDRGASAAPSRPGPSSHRSELLHIVQRNDPPAQISYSSFRNMPQSDAVQGLGLELGSADASMTGDETPRLGQMDWSSSRTPTMTQAACMPGAPQLPSAQSGRLNGLITSPINPPLRNWNTDLRFDERTPFVPSSRPPMDHRSFSESASTSAVAAAAMEREQAMDLEANMPHAHKLWGLAMSMDNGEMYRRGNYLYRPDGSMVGPAAMMRSVTGPQPMPSMSSPVRGPPTPARQTNAGDLGVSQRSASKSAAPSSTGKLHLSTTGLTPHIHKTRLTPTFSARSKGNGGAGGKGSPISGTESPSLKMKSKQRSEQLRNQAANIAAQAHLPSEHASVVGQSTSSAPTLMTDVQQDTSPSRADFAQMSQHSPHAQQQQPHDLYLSETSTSSPRKRSSRENSGQSAVSPSGTAVAATATATAATQQASSPWGVFELGSHNKNWQPLGPPALSNVLGKLNLEESGTAGGEEDEEDEDEDEFIKARAIKAKRARKTPLGVGSNSASRNASPLMPTTKMMSSSSSSMMQQRAASPYIKRRGTPNSVGSESGSNEEKENDVFGSSALSANGVTSSSAARSSVSPSKQLQSSQQGTGGARRLLSIR